MKKQLIIIAGSLALATGAMGQGAVTGFGQPQPFVSTGVGHVTEFDSGLYSGGLTMQIFFSSTATVNEINAINALNGTAGGGAAAQALLAGDGFLSVASTVTGLTANGNSSSISGFGTYQLNSTFAPSTVGYYALLFTGTSGAATGWTSVIASGSGTSGGGNYGVGTPGTPYSIGSGSTYASYLGSPGFNDIDLTTTVPEPGTMALAAIGGASLLLFRRRK